MLRKSHDLMYKHAAMIKTHLKIYIGHALTGVNVTSS